MSSGEYNTPDLASVLRTLAAYGQSSQPPTEPSQNRIAHAVELVPDTLEDGEYDPAISLNNLPPRIIIPAEHARPEPEPRLRSIKQSTTVDATSIMTWPAALRHVTRTVARNEAIMARIKKLIDVQHQHESQWWEGRKALIQKQKDRIEGRRKVDEVLKAVGGAVDPLNGGTSPEEDAAELTRYDKKVHRACTQMLNATIIELKTLSIPFFGMQHDLLLPDEEDIDVAMHNGIEYDESGGTKIKLRPKQLLELQKRMLGLLEDLCNE